ncbi:MAG: DNA polymerase III subunit beta [Patescibacteria group bacterium]
MRFIGLLENLKRGLNIVGHITTKNINLPILNNILIKAENGNIELISTNLEIGIIHQLRGKVEHDGQFTVDAKLVSDYVSLLSGGDKVVFEEKEGMMKIENGGYKTKIKGESAKEFPLIPTIPKENAIICSAEKLKESLNSVVFAVSNSENRAELTGVLFSFKKNRLTLAATDSYRLAEREIEIKTDGVDEEEGHRVIVPAKTVQEVLRILNNFEGKEDGNEVKIYLAENQILFTVDSVELISRLINGQYPDYKQIIPAKSQTTLVIERGELIRAVKAAALFSKTGVNDINLRITKNKVVVSAFSGSSGESKIELSAEINGGENEITINHRYLVEGLNNINNEVVRLEILNSDAPCLLKPEKEDGYLYIVMPIRQ